MERNAVKIICFGFPDLPQRTFECPELLEIHTKANTCAWIPAADAHFFNPLNKSSAASEMTSKQTVVWCGVRACEEWHSYADMNMHAHRS